MPILAEGQRMRNLRQVVASSSLAAVIRLAGAPLPVPGFMQRLAPMISLGAAPAKHATQVSYANKPVPPDMQLDRVCTVLQLTQLVREDNRAARCRRKRFP